MTPEKPPSRHRLPLPLLALAAVLVFTAPAPAHADILGDLIGGLTSAFNKLFDAVGGTSTSVLMGLKNMFNGEVKLAEYNAINQDRIARATMLNSIAQNYQPPTKYACARVTDSRSEMGRFAAGSMAGDLIESILIRTFLNPDSGTVITDKQLDTLFCQLGAIGKMRNGCQVEADPRVEGCDISFARCNGSHGRNIAIPFDPDSFVNDLKKALDELKKKDPSINVADGNKQIIAVLASLRKSLGRQCTWPGGRQMDTIKSVSEAARMGDVLESRYAPNEAVLHAIEVHLAYSNRFLPKCDDNDVGLMSYLKKAYPNAAPGNAYYPYLPPSGYCLSGWQVDLAKISRDRLALQEPPPPGTPAEQENWRTNLEHSIKARETAHRELMQLASDAAGGRTSASVCVETSRPISTSSLDGQDVQDLMGSIRSLTRAIQDLQQKRPHVLEVRAPASSPEPEYRPASAAALPPLRQDFPAVP